MAGRVDLGHKEIEIESWLAEQSKQLVLVWEKSIERFYPQYLQDWINPDAHLKALNEEWNLLGAARFLDWDKYLAGNSLRLLDLGAGTGWLSLMLSQRENVREIYTLDASPNNLRVMLPALAERMPSNLEKIKPVLGLFTPLMVGDEFFDAVVASSAVHHASDLAELFSEVHRVLKPGGWCLILNEQPFSSLRYALTTVSRCAKILQAVLKKHWQPIAKSVSESGILTDPFLGDRAFCDWQWRSAIQSAGFSFHAIETPYYSFKRTGRDWRQPSRLTHFVAQKLP